jgi:hypothetical protein
VPRTTERYGPGTRSRLAAGAGVLEIDLDHGAAISSYQVGERATELMYRGTPGSPYADVRGWYEHFPNAGPECVVDGVMLGARSGVRFRTVRLTGSRCRPRSI